jgi:hypothetical protein
MKHKKEWALFLAAVLFLTFPLMAQKPADMTGTWSGLATLEGMDDPNELVLVLELKEGNLEGHMTDQYGTMNESPMKEAKLEDGVFSFSVEGMGPGGQGITLTFKMNVEADVMEGILEIPDMGLSGTWEATKQK